MAHVAVQASELEPEDEPDDEDALPEDEPEPEDELLPDDDPELVGPELDELEHPEAARPTAVADAPMPSATMT